MISAGRSILLLIVMLGGCASLSDSTGVRKVLIRQQQADVAYEQGNWTEALIAYHDLLRDLPDDDEIWFRIGNSHARLDQSHDAIDAYRHVLMHDASHAKAWHNTGLMLMRQAQDAFIRSAETARSDKAFRDRNLVLVDAISNMKKSPEIMPSAIPSEPSSSGTGDAHEMP